MSCINNNALSNEGRGMELKYDFYFPESPPASSQTCLPFGVPTIQQSLATCRKIGYPLMTQPMCAKPCLTPPAPGPQNPVTPSELYGDVLAMNGGDGSFYAENIHAPHDISVLTYSAGAQPMHIQFST